MQENINPHKKGSTHLIVIALALLLIVGTAAYFLIIKPEKSDTQDTVSDIPQEVKEGGISPDFTGKNFFTGEEISYYRDLKGKKVVLLDFWSIYCVSCLKEVPELIKIYEKYKEKDIFFIGVDLDTSTPRLKKFFKDPKKIPPYVTIMDKRRTIAEALNVNILPTTIIIDKEGIIRLYHVAYKPGDENHIQEIIHDLTR